MKIVKFVFFFLLSNTILAQEITVKELTTKVSHVTVFLEGAQVVRKKSIVLPKGKTIVKFVNLSPFIDAKSVQVKAKGELTVLSVNHQFNYLKKMKKSAELKALNDKLEGLKDKIQLEKTNLIVTQEKIKFLHKNMSIGGKNEQLMLSNFKQITEYYGNKLASLKLKELGQKNTLKTLNNKYKDIQKQIKLLTNKKEYPTGELLVKVDLKKSGTILFEASYLVNNAGWFPTYDIRAKNIKEPIQIVYKANVHQNTRVDWNNVKLSFSSAEPNVSGLAPNLKTYFIDYYVSPPRYKSINNSVSGIVMDEQGEPLPGATIFVKGTTIGTVSDVEGRYSISIPSNASNLSFSFIGLKSKILPISNSVMNVSLSPKNIALEEVVVVSSGGRRSPKYLKSEKKQIEKKKDRRKYSIPVNQVENQTTVDFQIETPYTIISNNANLSVEMANYELPANYQYYAVPKVEKSAFLMANIIDWEKYNLMEGEANLYFEDTYVGKSILDVKNTKDTLQISLGRDKKIVVDRKKVKDFTVKQFIGNKKIETRNWIISIKNNKSAPINMIVLDQIPVSTNEQIEVSVENISNAIQNSVNGELKWKFDLKPSTKKEMEIKYSVKFPKNRNLIVE